MHKFASIFEHAGWGRTSIPILTRVFVYEISKSSDGVKKKRLRHEQPIQNHLPSQRQDLLATVM